MTVLSSLIQEGTFLEKESYFGGHSWETLLLWRRKYTQAILVFAWSRLVKAKFASGFLVSVTTWQLCCYRGRAPKGGCHYSMAVLHQNFICKNMYCARFDLWADLLTDPQVQSNQCNLAWKTDEWKMNSVLDDKMILYYEGMAIPWYDTSNE